MSINSYNIKKWYKMLTGNSILHVNQGKGKIYSIDKVAGYYNDLTEKVLKDKNTIDGHLPIYPREDGNNVYFSIAIFQYGLGSYDLFLKTNNKKYLNKFKLCVDWAVKNQDENGGWKTFEYLTPETPYSAMAQGEGISLLIRAYTYYERVEYLNLAKKAIYFLMRDVDNGGVTEYKENKIFLKEYVTKPVVLNGWIFSLFGIYDYLLVFKSDDKVKDFYLKTIKTLEQTLPLFDLGYWSKYDVEKKIASPFYHNVHIAQLSVLYELTNNSTFKKYSTIFLKYSNKKTFKIKAFLLKTIQKVKE